MVLESHLFGRKSNGGGGGDGGVVFSEFRFELESATDCN